MLYKDGEGEVFTLHTFLERPVHVEVPGKRRASREHLTMSWDSAAPTKLKMLVSGKWITLGFDTIEECVAVMVVLHHTYDVYAQ